MDPASSSPAEQPPLASIARDEASAGPAVHVLNYRAVRHLAPLQRAGFIAIGLWHMLFGVGLLTLAILFGIAAVGVIIAFIVSLMRRAPVLTGGFLVLFAFLYAVAMLQARRRHP